MSASCACCLRLTARGRHTRHCDASADILLLSPIADLEPAVRRELVRLAARTRASIEPVESHAPFEHLGGVGAPLRYRHRP